MVFSGGGDGLGLEEQKPHRSALRGTGAVEGLAEDMNSRRKYRSGLRIMRLHGTNLHSTCIHEAGLESAQRGLCAEVTCCTCVCVYNVYCSKRQAAYNHHRSIRYINLTRQSYTGHDGFT